jgi:predicted metalloprotease with PDZ domain
MRIVYFWPLFFCLFCFAAIGQTVQYHLEQYANSADTLSVSIRLKEPVKGPLNFVMPRSSPGSYSVALYDKFVQQLEAFDGNGVKIVANKLPDGPRWRIGNDSVYIKSIRYKISLEQLESGLEPSDISKLRPGYTSVLNYSVFGYLQGFENTPIRLTVSASPSWRVFSTLAPDTVKHLGSMVVDASDYSLLADAQTIIGERFKVKLFNKAPIPLYVVLYTEAYADIDLIGNAGVYALQSLKDYFDTMPFTHYTIVSEYLGQKYAGKVLGFTMEHANSLTAFLDTATAWKQGKDTALIFRLTYNLLHHIAHSSIPVRCYGENYKPFAWELPPVMDAIWAHEGFIRFVCYDILKRPSMLRSFQNIVYGADESIKKIPLIRLSQMGSTQYSADFRIGTNLYARGALMAWEIDQEIRKKSGGEQSFRVALQHLFRWSQQNKRGFTVAELPNILQEGIRTDIRPVFNKWLLPLE